MCRPGWPLARRERLKMRVANCVILCKSWLLLVIFCGPQMAKSADLLPKPADRIRNEPESVWVEFIQLALEHKPLDLGQGFPDFAAPKYLVESLQAATGGPDNSTVLNNQYTRSFGHPRLVRALTRYYRDFKGFRQLADPNRQVLVTVGAYEAIFATIMAFVNPGDEVVIIEPAFDAYAPIVAMAGGRSVYVPLRLAPNNSAGAGELSSADFRLDRAEFESKLSNRSRLLVLNTPNNPLGKMYDREELAWLAALCHRHNLLVLADEVYEQMHYSAGGHLSIGQLAGMWDRTVTVGSAGKSFSVTGWKVGWALGPAQLMRYVQLVHQTAVYTVATPLQEALARALEREMELLGRSPPADYWGELRAELLAKRRRMADILRRAGMRPVLPQGGYFMLADFSALAAAPGAAHYRELGRAEPPRRNSDDYRFARWLSKHRGLQAIPASAFYAAHGELAGRLLRFCFIKRAETLDRLEALVEGLAADPKPRL